jgi:hypothetical protein
VGYILQQMQSPFLFSPSAFAKQHIGDAILFEKNVINKKTT